MEGLLTRQANDVAGRLRKHGLSGRTVTIKVRMHDFTTLSRSSTLGSPTDSPGTIARLARCAADRPRHLRRRAAARRRRLRPRRLGAGGPVRRDDRGGGGAARRSRCPTTRGSTWAPGMDVVHTEMGRGWVWGSGRGVVTVRFETAETPAGPVRSYADDDPALSAWRPPLGGAATEADLLARPQLRALPQVVGVRRRRSPGSHRSAGGRPGTPRAGRSAAPAPRPAPSPRWRARRPAPHERRPVEAQPDPVGVGVDDVRRPAQHVQRVVGEPVVARPRHDPQRPGPRRSGCVERRRLAGSAPPPADRSPASTRGGPTHASVSVEREPSTGSTAMPPATATYERSPVAGSPMRSARSGGQPLGARPLVADGAGDRDPAAGVAAQHQPAEQHLEHGGVRVVADHPVRQRGGRGVERARARDAEVREAEPAPVLDRHQRAGLEDVRGHRGHEPDPGARRQQRRRLPRLVPQRRRRCGRAAASRPARRSGRRRTSRPRARPSRPAPRARGDSSRGTASSRGQPGQVGEARARTRRTPRRTRSRCAARPRRPRRCPTPRRRTPGPGRRTSTGTSTSSPAGASSAGDQSRERATSVGRRRRRTARSRRPARPRRRRPGRARPGRQREGRRRRRPPRRGTRGEPTGRSCMDAVMVVTVRGRNG